MKKFLSILLILSMLLGTLLMVGCKDPVGPNGPDGPGGGGGDTEFLDNLDTAAIKKELNGKVEEVTISVFSRYAYEVYAEESSRDARDELIRKRNKKIEERFGIKIKADITKETGPSDMQSHYTYVNNQFGTSSPNFDVVAMMAYQSGKNIATGNYRDWRKTVPYARDSIKAGDAWWPAEMNKNSTVNGRQFVAVSDMSITLIDLSFAILFNETMAKNENIASTYNAKYTTMYDIVKDGQWTLDALIDITKDFWRDNPDPNAEGKDKVDKDDTLGFVISPATELDNFAWASGFTYIQNDGISNPEVWAPTNTFDNLVTKIRSYLADSKGAATTLKLASGYEDRTEKFRAGKILFVSGTLSNLNDFAGMDNDYGVLPYPKFLSTDASYKTGAQDNITVLSVSRFTNSTQLKATGAMIVALSAETTKSVNKTYYEMLLKHDSGLGTTDALAMIDLIMAGRVYDLSIYHYSDLTFDSDSSNATLGLMLRYLVVNAPNQHPNGLWGQIQSGVEGNMRNLITVYANNKF